MNIELFPLFLIILVVFTASYIQSVTGFGFGIFAMIFLPHILTYTEANVLSSILSAFTSITVVAVMLPKTHWKNIFFPLIGFSLSSYYAVNFIKAQSNDILTLLLGIALFSLSIYLFFFSKKIIIKPTWYAGLIAGTFSMILGSFIGRLTRSKASPMTIRRAVYAVMALSGVLNIGSVLF